MFINSFDWLVGQLEIIINFFINFLNRFDGLLTVLLTLIVASLLVSRLVLPIFHGDLPVHTAGEEQKNYNKGRKK